MQQLAVIQAGYQQPVVQPAQQQAQQVLPPVPARQQQWYQQPQPPFNLGIQVPIPQGAAYGGPANGLPAYVNPPMPLNLYPNFAAGGGPAWPPQPPNPPGWPARPPGVPDWPSMPPAMPPQPPGAPGPPGPPGPLDPQLHQYREEHTGIGLSKTRSLRVQVTRMMLAGRHKI